MKFLIFAMMLVGLSSFSTHAQEATDQPVELGSVKWLRDLDSAVANSKKEQRPIAILFQEVPG